MPVGAAEQRGDRYLQEPAGQVPQGDVDGGERVGLVSDQVAALAHQLGGGPDDRARAAGVRADELSGQGRADDGGDDLGTDRCERLTPAGRAVLGGQPDQHSLEAG